MNGPAAAPPEITDLPRRDRAALWGTGRLAATPVTRELMTRIVRGLYPDWDLWTLGCFFIAAPKGADPLASPAVINAASVSELIVMISETAAGAR